MITSQRVFDGDSMWRAMVCRHSHVLRKKIYSKGIMSSTKGNIPKGLCHQPNHTIIKYYFCDIYLFRSCPGWIIRQCLFRSEANDILKHFNSRPNGVHHGAQYTTNKVFNTRFYWPSIFKDDTTFLKECDSFQRSGIISSWNEMP